MERELLQSAGISEETENKARDLWNSGSVRLDIPIIDLQHLWLVALISELARETKMDESSDADRVKKLLIELVDFATEHFGVKLAGCDQIFHWKCKVKWTNGHIQSFRICSNF